jgi:hypothetical protein
VLVEKLCKIAKNCAPVADVDMGEQALAFKVRHRIFSPLQIFPQLRISDMTTLYLERIQRTVKARAKAVDEQVDIHKAMALRHINAISSLLALRYMDNDTYERGGFNVFTIFRWCPTDEPRFARRRYAIIPLFFQL